MAGNEGDILTEERRPRDPSSMLSGRRAATPCGGTTGPRRHAAGEPVVAPRRHEYACLHPRLGRIGDILCPGLLENLLGVGPLGAVFRVYGNQYVAFLNFPLVAFGLVFRNA
jgi:hypothetical protein